MGDPLISEPTSKINFSDKLSNNSECQPFLMLTMAEKIGMTKCYLDQIRFDFTERLYLKKIVLWRSQFFKIKIPQVLD